MYYPFLRGKREELTALLELDGLIRDSGTVVPIIEPMNFNTTTAKYFKNVIDNNDSIIVIANSKYIEAADRKKVYGLFKAKNIIPAINISTKEDFNEYKVLVSRIGSSNKVIPVLFQQIDEIDELIKDYSNTTYVLFLDRITDDKLALIQNKNKTVILSNPFIPALKNADYPANEFFSNMHNDYKQRGHIGFSDFQMIGRKISSGGPAYAVALHWTCIKNNKQMWAYHYISDDKDSQANVQGKYFQALKKLIKHFSTFENHVDTVGAINYRENDADQDYHGLGYPKRISIKNHIELLSKY
jgi:hypothetical protein